MTESTEKTPAFELTADVAAASGVGDALRQARESQGLSLQNAAQRLRLGAAQIQAIESENWHVLPGRVFIIGFVRNYARFLGIADVEALIERLQKALPNEAMPKLEIKPGDVIVPPRADNRAMVIALSLLVVVILGYFLLPDEWSNALGNLLPQKNKALTVEKEVLPSDALDAPSAMPAMPTIPAPMLESPMAPSVLENPLSISAPPALMPIAKPAPTADVLPPPAPALPAAKPEKTAKPITSLQKPATPEPAAAIPAPVAKPAPVANSANVANAKTANSANSAPSRALSPEEQAKIRAENLAKIRAENLAKFRGKNQTAPADD